MWPPFCLATSWKTSLSRYYTLCFCIKQYNFHLLIYSQPPVVRHFTSWWHLSHFPWTTALTGTFATSILWRYNFNGMIKWYDISCATLYKYIYIYILFACWPQFYDHNRPCSSNIPHLSWILMKLKFSYFCRSKKTVSWIIRYTEPNLARSGS